MARIPYPNLRRADGYAIDLLQTLEEKRGRPTNLHLALGHAPGLLGAMVQIEKELRMGSLEPRLAALAMLATSRANGSAYAEVRHRTFAEKAGVPARQQDEIDRADSSDAFDPRERAIVRYAVELTRLVRPADKTCLELAMVLSPAQQVELAFVVGLANLVDRFAEALALDPDPAPAGTTGALATSTGSGPSSPSAPAPGR